MLTDTQKLEWIAEHLTSFNIGVAGCHAYLTYIDDKGYVKTVSVSVDEEPAPLELLNLAIEKATSTIEPTQ